MTHYWLTFNLKSDATFGRGDGVAGLIDREVEHDRYGLPFLRGRTLKGLLCEEADNLIYALQQAGQNVERWQEVRATLFGEPGSKQKSGAVIHYGRAQLPESLRETIIRSEPQLEREEVLGALTALRRQTAIEPDGVPAEGSLRTMRVILRDTDFEARLTCQRALEPDEEALLAAATLAFRRAGTGRNRGRGRLAADLLDERGQSVLMNAYSRFIGEEE